MMYPQPKVWIINPNGFFFRFNSFLRHIWGMKKIKEQRGLETFETFDIKIPEELKGKIKEGHQISYWTILGQKVMRE